MQPLPQLGRALLVQLEPGLDVWRRTGIWAAIRFIPGVTTVVDMAAISRETLDVFLLPDDQKVKTRKR